MVKQIILYTLSLFACMACTSPEGDFVTIQGTMLGTSIALKAQINTHDAEQLKEDIMALDREMKSQMSIFDPNSLISKINNNSSVETTPWMRRNIQLADSISRLSNGVYDITVAPLVKAYGFASKRYDPEKVVNVDSIIQFVGYDKISIVDNKIVKEDSRIQIDLNSIAKGFAVDCLAEIVESYGAKNYMVDIGGEIRIAGSNPDGNPWRIGVETPFEGNNTNGEYIEQCIAIPDSLPLRAVATSGNYRRYHTDAQGRKIVHTIDPSTGLPKTSQLLSVTVLAPTCALADGYATMLLAAGDKEAERLALQIEGCEVYLIYHNDGDQPYREFATPTLKSLMMN